MKTKVCSNPECTEPEKAVSEFYKQKSGKDGLTARCKVCVLEGQKAYYEANKEARKAKARQYYEENREKVQETSAKWRDANKEKISEARKKYYAENQEALKAKSRQWAEDNPERKKATRKAYYSRPEIAEAKRAADKQYYLDNKEACNARQRAYYAENREESLASSKAWREANREYKAAKDAEWKRNNPHKVSTSNRRRQVLKKALQVEEVDYEVLYARDTSCYLCGVEFAPEDKTHVDHKIPLSRLELSPTHSYENCAVTHASCNLAKSAQTPEEFWASRPVGGTDGLH